MNKKRKMVYEKPAITTFAVMPSEDFMQGILFSSGMTTSYEEDTYNDDEDWDYQTYLD